MNWEDLKNGDAVIVTVKRLGPHSMSKLRKEHFVVGKRYPATFLGHSSNTKYGYRLRVSHNCPGLMTKVFVSKGSSALGQGDWGLVDKIEESENWEFPDVER